MYGTASAGVLCWTACATKEKEEGNAYQFFPLQNVMVMNFTA
jgi:hypothetical protein